MRQIFRIGTLVSALLIATAGCASVGWFGDRSGEKEAESTQPREEERVSQRAPVATDGKVPSQIGAVDVLFAFDRSDLNHTAQASLQALLTKLRENPKLSVELAGYADSAGARDYNLRLTQKRVEAVRRHLVDSGVAPARIRSAGLGQLPDRGTPEERAKNRRVTVKLMASE